MTEGFFPGSQQPLAPVQGTRKLIPDDLGKVLTVKGIEVRLFSVGELAFLLNRTSVTIRKWERLGVIPRATFVKPGINRDPRGRRRLYSQAQVEALIQIAEEEKILHNVNAKIGTTRFKAKAHDAFRRLQNK